MNRRMKRTYFPGDGPRILLLHVDQPPNDQRTTWIRLRSLFHYLPCTNRLSTMFANEYALSQADRQQDRMGYIKA